MAYGVRLRVRGDYACFTRPEMKVERVSYDVPTPSGMRGILESVYWKPQIKWVIERIHVLKPIHFTSVRRNEVASKVPAGTVKTVMKKGTGNLGLFVEDDRQQRAATILRDVDYVVEARFEFTDKDTEGNVAKHLDQFNRRVRKGQCFHRPYLGCREFPATFEPVEGDIPVSALAGEKDSELGFMLFDVDFANGMQPMFYRPVMKRGIIEVPPPDSPEVFR